MSVVGDRIYVATVRGLQVLRTSAAVVSVMQLGETTYRLQLGTSDTTGHYALTIGPAIADTLGTPMNQDGDNKFGEFTDDAFHVAINYSSPTQINLSSNQVAEKQPLGTVVGTFSTTDRDAGETFVYSLVSGEGDADNGSFTIDASGKLRTDASFDYLTKSSYTIRVRSTDSTGLSCESAFTIRVTSSLHVVSASSQIGYIDVTFNRPVDLATFSPEDVSLVPDHGAQLQRLGQTGGDFLDVDVVGNYAYVATGLELLILDITNPAAPNVVGRYDTPGSACGVTVVGHLAYVAGGAAGLEIFDIANPAAPTLVGSYGHIGYIDGVSVVGNMAYLANISFGLQILDVANPAAPSLVKALYLATGAHSVTVVDNLAYVAGGDAGLVIVNVTNPAAPSVLARCDTPGLCRGRYRSGQSGPTWRTVIWACKSWTSPTRRQQRCWGGGGTVNWAFGVAVAGNRAFVASNMAGLQVFDISNAAAPSRLGSYDTPGSAYGVTVVGNLAYVADEFGGLQIVGVADASSPYLVGRYALPGASTGRDGGGGFGLHYPFQYGLADP